MKKPLLTKTVKRIALWNAALILSFYLAFNLFTLFVLNYIVIDDIDVRLKHELEHIINSFEIIDNKFILTHARELEEEDLVSVTDNPFFLQIYDLTGNIILKSKNLDFYKNILLGFPNRFSPYYYEKSKVGNDRLRIIYKELFDNKSNKFGYAQLSTIDLGYSRIVKNLFLFNLISLPFIILIITFLSIFLAKKSYKPVNKIIELAETISVTNLKKRLQHNSDENDVLDRLNTTLNSLFERLDHQIEQISHFTDNASHQLMTPLTVLKAELDYLTKREYLNQDLKDSLLILKEQTEKMITMTKTMLILARDCTECRTSIFELNNLMQNEIKPSFENFSIDYELEKEIYLRGKSEYFALVVHNLIQNSIKYSLKNNIRIKLSAIKKNDSIIITVEDNGVGIPDSEKEKVFNRFYRIENKSLSNVNGYGLGLSLVQSIVNSMNGKITIKDNIPQGTIFIITLPAVKLT